MNPLYVVAYLLGTILGLLLLYWIIKSAVKDGTRPVVEELRKQREKEPV